MRQLQALLQPQTASLEALRDTVNKMNTVLQSEWEVVSARINTMHLDFEKRLKTLEERGKSTSPPRKTPRGNEADVDMDLSGDGPPTSQSTASTLKLPPPRRTTFARASSAPPLPRGRATESDDDCVVIFKLPELSTSRAARAWWSTFTSKLGGEVPKPVSVRVLDFHDHVTAKFTDAEDALMFHDAIRALPMVFVKLDGAEDTVEAFRPRPPHIKRRGAAFHPVYGVLQRHDIKQVHRTRGPQPHTLYYGMKGDTEEIRLLATVSWRDDGSKAALVDVIPEPVLGAEAQAALRGLVLETVG